MPTDGSPSAPAAWSTTRSDSDRARRLGRIGAVIALLAFALLTWFAVPHGIGVSWRECDTQAIARNFLSDGFDPLRPRIDWRGDTDGAVECEFPLYQLAVASVLGVFDRAAEWPGRLLALLATLWAGLSLHRLLELRTGAGGALVGLLVFLSCGSTMLVATRVMPDSLSLALGIASLTAFVRYLASGSRVALVASMAALAFAGLQKPLALQIGWVMFGWTALLAPRRLRDLALWGGWLAVVAVVFGWMLHAKSLHDETGLTFGVLAGGDTKFPTLDHLLMPELHLQLGRTSVQYGLSALGIFSGTFLLCRRQLDGPDLVLAGSVIAALYLSLRYSYHGGMGPHYHMFAAVLGAWLVARAWPSDAGRRLWWLLLAVVAVQGAWRLAVERHERSGSVESPLLGVAASIRDVVKPEELVVVRSAKQRWDEFWQRRNNFEEPILLYQTGLRGWVLPCDGFGVDALRDLRDRGARLVVDCLWQEHGPTQSWLEANGELLVDEGGMRLHRLRDASTAGYRRASPLPR